MRTSSLGKWSDARVELAAHAADAPSAPAATLWSFADVASVAARLAVTAACPSVDGHASASAVDPSDQEPRASDSVVVVAAPLAPGTEALQFYLS